MRFCSTILSCSYVRDFNSCRQPRITLRGMESARWNVMNCGKLVHRSGVDSLDYANRPLVVRFGDDPQTASCARYYGRRYVVPRTAQLLRDSIQCKDSCSRFALIAGGTPAVPVFALSLPYLCRVYFALMA